jgi:hypothetical protein
MKIVRNDKLIKRNKTIGNVTSIAGIAILVFGLFLSFNPTPTKTLISFIALIVGFIIAQISTYFVTRFGREPRYDEVIGDNLAKLNNEYTFYVYSTPIAMALVGPAGIWIPIPTSASGEITYDKRWKQRGGGAMMKIFGQENIGRPTLDIENNIKEIQKVLASEMPEEQIPPIKGILVVMNPKATIGDVAAAPELITEAEALRRTIRKYDRKVEDEAIPAETLAKINEIFGGE